MGEVVIEILKLTVGPILTVALTAAIGLRLTAIWNERSKRRELELSAAEAFYKSYGEFCAIWKGWNWYHSYGKKDDQENYIEKRMKFMERAAVTEGQLEAVLLKLSAERRLSVEICSDLGNLRQAYQVLRERIQSNSRISYGSSEHADYLEFKRLATMLGSLLARRSKAIPTAVEAFAAFKEITSNRHERRWEQTGR